MCDELGLAEVPIVYNAGHKRLIQRARKRHQVKERGD